MKRTRATLEVILNGEAVRISSSLLPDALDELGYDPDQAGIAVAINMSVAPRSEWGATSIAEGDRIDIVGARQGG